MNRPPSFDGENGNKGNGFAQIGASTETGETHSCHFTAQRNKEAVDDFFGLYSGSSQYTDDDFTPGHDSLFWADRDEEESEWEKRVEWKRANEVFTNHSLFGSEGVTPEDIRQGFIGNCWFVVGASALAERAHRLERVFLNSENTLSPNGIYGVNFYTLGVPHTVIIDDWLPLQEWGDGYNTLFARVGPDQAIWVPLLEKAFAKYHGNYSHIVAGNPMYSIRSLSGAPFFSEMHHESSRSSGIAVDALWAKITEMDGGDHMITAGTPTYFKTGVDAHGLVRMHAYLVLSHIEVTDANNKTTRLVKMRNPQATDYFIGDWSDTSDKWTESLKEQAGYERSNNGIFFMSIEDYHKLFEETYFSLDTTNWHFGSYLNLDDADKPSLG